MMHHGRSLRYDVHVNMASKFHLVYSILVHKYKNAMNMLQKEKENPLKISFFSKAENKIMIYVSMGIEIVPPFCTLNVHM